MKKLLLTFLVTVGLCALPSLANAQAGTTAGVSQGVALVLVGAVVLANLIADDDAPAPAYSGACVGWSCNAANSLPVAAEAATTTTTTTTS